MSLFCPHGLQEEICPHCSGPKISPPKILVKPALRELPIRVPARDLLMEKKTLQSNKLFSQNKIGAITPQAPTRDFQLAQNYFGNKPGLFQERKVRLEKKHGSLPNEEVSFNDIPLYGLKKRALDNN